MSTDQQDLRERIAATLASHDLPDNTDRDGQWAADALMPLIAAEIGRLEAEIDRADLRADRRAADLRTQNKRIRDLENTIAGRDSRIIELESRLARSQNHRADLTRKNGGLQALAAATRPRRTEDQPRPCRAPAYGLDWDEAAHCDRPAGHAGWHTTEDSSVEWADFITAPTHGGHDE